MQLRKDKKRVEELLALKEKEIIELKTEVLKHEEQSLKYQQELLEYKRDAKSKIVELQSKYSITLNLNHITPKLHIEELNRIQTEKQNAIQELSMKIQQQDEKK